jgi:RimJ/RimL family protein N-acetyltransferase
MSAGPDIRRLGPDDAAALISLRREALDTEPLAFGASAEDDALTLDDAPALLAPGREHAVFGLFLGADLAGMVGVRREPSVKRRHVAVIWGMYVTPPARGQGRSRALLHTALEQARRWPGVDQVELAVSDTATAARRLYESLGFRAWGREPRALHWRGRFVDDHHLVLDLRAPGA